MTAYPDESQGDTADWGNFTWVLVLMHYPREYELLARIKNGGDLFARPDDVRAEMQAAAKAGVVAGNVLGILYVLSSSPWQIAEPSLEKAIHAAERFPNIERFADGSAMPRGRTEIRKCFDAMRPVAHLWAALRLHRRYPIGRHEDLLRSAEGLERLLRIAQGLQSWAINWQPRRSSSTARLLTDRLWEIPDSIRPLHPPWGDKPDWLLSTVGRYKRRTRTKV